MGSVLLPIVMLLPLLGGLLLAVLRPKNAALRSGILLGVLLTEALLCVLLAAQETALLEVFSVTETLTVRFRMDGVSKLFLLIAAFGFLAAGIYAIPYMKHAGRENSFFPFFLLAQGALMGMDLAGNLTTMYLFFELLTLMSMPMVLHERSKESIRAALKYLFYSIGGAFLAMGSIFFLTKFCTTTDFIAGGALDPAKVAGNETLLQIVFFLGIVGFSAKAGMYPLHGWLPAAHPVAPAPASAVLSGIVAKAGILAVIRMLFFSVGASFLQGTWAQYALLGLALLTVFMGSMMAYRETDLKKRLAYSSVSQLSYVLVGLFLMTPQGLTGGLLHVLFHAVIKICLFMVAGALISVLGKRSVKELDAVGSAMPITLGAFTLASLALVGIPPFSGFVSKWYLALGALDSGLQIMNWLTPLILLISALLTAAYLLPISIHGFFPQKDQRLPQRTKEGGPAMWVPIAVLAVLSLLLGVFSGPLVERFSAIAASVLPVS